MSSVQPRRKTRHSVRTSQLFGAGVLLATWATCSSAWAEDDPKAEASIHFNHAVSAFEDRRYAEAAEEFETAYRLSPAFVVLYNIGQVNVALGNAVKAVDAFTHYLEQGAANIPLERREQVHAEIQAQLGRIGTLTVRSNVPNAEIRVDGRKVGSTPLTAPLRVNEGSHTLQLSLPDQAPQTRELEVAGRAQIEIEFQFKTAETSGSAKPAVAPQPPTATNNAQQDAAPQWQRIVGYGACALGAVVTGDGIVRIWTGVSDAQDVAPRFGRTRTNSAYEAVKADYNAARDAAQTGWIVTGVGLGVVAAGALLVLTAPAPTHSAFVLTPWTTAKSAGLSFNGVW